MGNESPEESKFEYLTDEELSALSDEQRVKYFQEVLAALKQGQGHRPDTPPSGDKK